MHSLGVRRSHDPDEMACIISGAVSKACLKPNNPADLRRVDDVDAVGDRHLSNILMMAERYVVSVCRCTHEHQDVCAQTDCSATA